MKDKKPTYEELEVRIEELLLSLRRQTFILDSMNDSMFIRLPEGRFLEVNEVACKIYGYTKEELLQMTPMDLDIPEHAELVPSRTKSILEDGSMIFETVHRTKDGTIIQAEISSRPITYDGKQAILSVVRDITVRKQNEEELNKHRENLEELIEERTEALADANNELIEHITERAKIEKSLSHEMLLSQEYINSLPGLFYVFDEERFVRWNSMWKPYTGYSDEELSQMYGTDFFEGEDKKLIAERMQKVFQEGAADAEAELLTKDGRKIPYYFTGICKVFDEKKHLIGFGIDITERKRVEKMLQVSEVRYRRLFEAAKDGILILNAETGEVDDVNPFLVEILDYSREQFLGKKIWELGFVRNIFANKDHFEKLKSKEYIRYEDMPLETADGRRIDVEFVSNVYLVNNKKVIQCNIRNITDRKRAEGELKRHREHLEELVTERTNELMRTQEQLIQSQKMEVVGQLASGISHDFNNMLAIILGTSELILRNLKPDDPNHARLCRVIKTGKRAKNLTGRLLTFARKEKLEIVCVSIQNILLDVMDILSDTLAENIEVQNSVFKDNIMILGDVNQLGLAFMNICINACDAMKEGGKLKIDATPVSLDDDFRLAHGLKPCDYCLIQIRDEGTGIPADTLNRIFEPFFTTREIGTGTGLGLVITEGIVKMHNGLIEVESELGKGTNVKVYLPTAKEPFAGDKTKSDESSPQGNQETILIVDDDKDFSDMLSEFLSEQSYNPVAANNSKEALDIFEKSRDDIKLVILDIMMFGMNGGEVFTALRHIRQDVKVVICSGFSPEGKATEIINQGACAFIQKPFDSQILLKTISDVLLK